MVPEEHARVERGVEPLHHVARLEPPGEVLRPAVQGAGRQVAHRGVGIVDEELRGAGGHRAVDRRVHLAEEQVAAERVVVAAGQALLPVHDAGHALHVRREINLHAGIVRSRRTSGQVS